jgi:hypothetical protein
MHWERYKEFVIVRVISWIGVFVVAKVTIHESTRNRTKPDESAARTSWSEISGLFST